MIKRTVDTRLIQRFADYLEKWKASHEGATPKTYAEKKEFGRLVKSGARTSNAEGGEENYDEAEAAVLKSLNPPGILSSAMDQLFKYTPSEVEAKSSFWTITAAVCQIPSYR
jgi:amyloid beta precursor protein binding protein 1